MHFVCKCVTYLGRVALLAALLTRVLVVAIQSLGVKVLPQALLHRVDPVRTSIAGTFGRMQPRYQRL